MFAEILAPTIGTAVRRAVAEAISELLQRVNQLLERGLSLASVKWRLEARRTGRPFEEIVLAHTLVYRVDWVVLIHGESGLVLEQAVVSGAALPVPDQTSAMLHAINSFVHDALQSASPGGELQAIEAGDLRIWIERDAAFTLALALRGSAPAGLRDTLRQTLEHVRTLHDEPERIPDIATYADTHPLLVDCLKEQRAKIPRRAQWLLGALGVVALLLIGFALHARAARRQQDGRIRASYQAVLAAEPGIVVTGVERERGGYTIKGLRDPRALPADRVIANARLPVPALELAPFASLDPRLPRPAQPLEIAGAAIRDLEAIEIAFASGVSSVSSDDPLLRRASDLVNGANRAAAQAQVSLCVDVIGDSDDKGTPRFNETLRAARAEQVATVLRADGVSTDMLAPRSADMSRTRDHARRVTFRAVLRPERQPQGCSP